MSNSITISEIEAQKENMEFFENKIIYIEDIFRSKPEILLDTKKLELFLNGVKLKTDKEDGIYKIYSSFGSFIGVGEVKQGKLKRDVVINCK